jgi:hypothetical protein
MFYAAVSKDSIQCIGREVFAVARRVPLRQFLVMCSVLYATGERLGARRNSAQGFVM